MLKHLRARTEGKSLLEKGFTLVELLVVIVILGILAAVVVFAVGGTEKNADLKACLADRSAVESAAESYAAQNNGTPAPDMKALATGDPTTALLRHPSKYFDITNGKLTAKTGVCNETTQG